MDNLHKKIAAETMAYGPEFHNHIDC